MSASEILVTVPPRVTAPRGAQWAASFMLWLLRRARCAMTAINHGSVTLGSAYKRQTPTLLQALGQSIWRALEDAGRRRAAPELRRLAQRWRSIDPALAQQLLDASHHDTRR